MYAQHLLAALNPVAISAVFVAIVLAASRLAPFTKPYWTFFPKVVQAWLPSIVAGLPVALSAFSSVKTWLDFAQAVLTVGAVAMPFAVPGMSSPHNHPDVPPTAKPPTFGAMGPMGGMLAALCLALFCLTGCGLLAAASPYLAEAGVLIADASNAVNAAEAILPSLHLPASDESKAQAAISKCRKMIAAAAEADNGAKDLTAEQLDASLASFRAAWADIQQTFAAKKAGMGVSLDGGTEAPALPVPLAMRRVYQ